MTPCEPGFACSPEGTCVGADTDEPCVENSDCTEVCIAGACSPPNGVGGVCDESADCVAGLVCTELVCEVDPTIDPTGPAPLAQFVVRPGAGTTATLFEFDASSSVDPTGGPLTFRWDLDDDGVPDPDISGSPLTHMFATEGLKHVTLFAATAAGQIHTYDGYVRVVPSSSLIIVTTALDTNVADDGETSLREAIDLANALSGANTISVPTPLQLQVDNMLPFVTDPDTSIFGSAGAGVDCAGAGVNPCLDFRGDRNELAWLTVTNAADAVEINGIGSWIANTAIRDNTGIAVRTIGANATIGPHVVIDSCATAVLATGSGLVVDSSRITGATDTAVDLRGDSATMRANLLHDNLFTVIIANTIVGLTFWNNTLAFNAGAGLDVRNSSNIDARNNIFSHSAASSGLSAGGQASFVALDHNAFFNNATADCNSCTPGSESVIADPLFADEAARDFSLADNSPCRDAGVDVGLDRNGGREGSFDGTAPDIGAVESP